MGGGIVHGEILTGALEMEVTAGVSGTVVSPIKVKLALVVAISR